ncbi:MAG: c-type cytochrome biogenesis protein CcmI [Pseudomonadota bacterium]
MIIFALTATAMAALALFFILPSLLRQEAATVTEKTQQCDSLNLALLRDQLHELDADLQAGVINQSAYQAARRELEVRVADEVQPAPHALANASRQSRTAWVLALAFPLLAGSLYALLGTSKGLAPAPPAIAKEQNVPAVTPAQIAGMVNRLAERLKSNPDDADGWRMLARSYETMQRFDLAVDAYQHLFKLTTENPDLLTDYAVTLAMSLNQSLSGEPEKIINRALEIDPQHIQALALSGSAAFERKEYVQATKQWKKILTLLPQKSEMARSIAANIAKAEGLAQSSALP